MKQGILLTVIAIFTLGCDNSIDILAPKQERPIVYALWSVHDSLPRIRIQRTFLNPNQDAHEVAKHPDSIYYSHPISVTVEEWKNDALQQVISFTEYKDFAKDSGIFHYPYLPIYRPASAVQLDAEAEYVLKVKVGERLPTVKARTPLVGSASFLNPRPASPPSEFRFSMLNTYVISWFPAKHAYYYDLWVIYNILEIRGIDTQHLRLRIPLLRMTPSRPNQRMSYVLTAESFYRDIRQHLTIDSTITRRFGNAIFYYRGVEQQAYYYEILNSTTQGINQTDTFYTNIQNGIGLFSSATVDSVLTVPFIGVLDSLRLNPTMKPYNFIY